MEYCNGRNKRRKEYKRARKILSALSKKKKEGGLLEE
jgi:hypothetical protein